MVGEVSEKSSTLNRSGISHASTFMLAKAENTWVEKISVQGEAPQLRWFIYKPMN